MVEVCGAGFREDIISSAKSAYVSTKSGGTGLGLAIVDRIITEHCGELDIFNNKDGGATIKLTFNAKELKSKLK